VVVTLDNARTVKRLEYFDDQSLRRPVSLLYGNSSEEAALLRSAVTDLADGTGKADLRVDGLPGFLGIDGCSLIASVTTQILAWVASRVPTGHFGAISTPLAGDTSGVCLTPLWTARSRQTCSSTWTNRARSTGSSRDPDAFRRAARIRRVPPQNAWTVETYDERIL